MGGETFAEKSHITHLKDVQFIIEKWPKRRQRSQQRKKKVKAKVKKQNEEIKFLEQFLVPFLLLLLSVRSTLFTLLHRGCPFQVHQSSQDGVQEAKGTEDIEERTNEPNKFPGNKRRSFN